ncbi:DUF151 domain-containing protein [Halosquirtibacter laminarini]|uniref:DUF151 domain-containing protein n=1 Tax=Halosquirtibacter laminarini TaxID=3374600 RepID=A0AC61NFA3_9BACT|nr:DUF151 domain-containing protein [Prolixibacteraceae bacterium]
MHKIKLRILGLTTSQTQNGAYALLMTEDQGNRRLPIIIGAVEAQAIVIFLEQMSPPRPLTHDLFYQSLNGFGIELKEVIIYKLEEGVYFSKLIYIRDNETKEVESRTSDAIALALRFSAPIFIESAIMDKAGISLELNDTEDMLSSLDEGENEEDDQSQRSGDEILKDQISETSTKDLEMLLSKAIEEEDYEAASMIRDEVNKRKNSETDF